MSVNGKNQVITVNDLISVARHYSINRPERIIEQVMDVVSRVDDYLRQDGMNKSAINAIMSELNEKHAELKA